MFEARQLAALVAIATGGFINAGIDVHSASARTASAARVSRRRVRRNDCG
jgi:hypothetical protein